MDEKNSFFFILRYQKLTIKNICFYCFCKKEQSFNLECWEIALK